MDSELGALFSSREQGGLLNAVLSSNDSPEMLIPVNSTAERLFAALDATASCLGAVKKAQQKLRPVVGRILTIIESNPELYRGKGYETFDSFLKGYVEDRLGLSRTDSYFSKRLVEKFPTMPLGTYEALGPSRMDRIMRAGINETSPAAQRIIDAAATGGQNGGPMPVKDLETMLANEGRLDPDEIKYESVVLRLNKITAQIWREFRSDPRIVAFVGADSDSAFLGDMMAECRSSWEPQMTDVSPE